MKQCQRCPNKTQHSEYSSEVCLCIQCATKQYETDNLAKTHCLCKDCGTTKSKKWYKGGTECLKCYVKKRHKKIYAEQGEYLRKRHNEYCKANPGAIKNTYLKGKFGITLDEYQRMLVSQGGTCAICRSSSPGRVGVRYFSVDHDHDTGRVRQLLCSKCNTGIGLLQDSPAILEAALKYLKRHGK